MTVPGDFAAAVIAGGKSSRMGRDKAFLEVDDLPLWRRQIALLQGLSPAQVILSANPRQVFPSLSERVTLVRDAVENAGPLAGLAAVLAASRCPRVLVIAVDMPELDAPFLEKLVAAEECVVFRDEAGFFEPFPAVYPAAAEDLAREALRTGRLALQDFLRERVDDGSMSAWPRVEEERRFFRSWNRPDDIAP